MRVNIFRHNAFEGTGSIGPWLAANGASVGETLLYETHTLPDPARLDMLVVMGGTMSANNESDFPWLRAEKACIRAAIDRGVRVLGICLGSQLIASAMGARVYRNEFAEHGWFPVESTSSDRAVFQFPRTFSVFHSHGDTFDLPPGAVRLAQSQACANQAFQIGRHTIGLQFHLESTPESAGAIVEECVNEFPPGPYVQPEFKLRATPPAAYDESVRLMGDMLEYLAQTPTR